MASSAQIKGRSGDGLQRALPRLFKFALAVSANDELARILLRSTCKAAAIRRNSDRDRLMDACRRMYALWTAKLTQDPSFSKRFPAEPRLFTISTLPASFAGNAHFGKFVASLPPVQRAVLYLVYGEGSSYDEAAEVLGLPIQGLMKQLARAHAALSHWFEHRGINQGDGFEHAAAMARLQQDRGAALEREWAA